MIRRASIRPRTPGGAPWGRLAWCVAVLAALAACNLIDQTTFAPSPQPPSTAQLAALPPVGGPPPLLSIGYATPDPDYAGALRTAVAAVERERPGSVYNVVAVVPAERDPVQQVRALDRTRQDAAQVMQAMIALGVPASRLRLGARTDPALTVRQVRVYLG